MTAACGSAVLHGIGTDPILLTPVGAPRETAAQIAVLLDHEHDVSADEPLTDELVTEFVPKSEQRPTDVVLPSASEQSAAFVQISLLNSAFPTKATTSGANPNPDTSPAGNPLLSTATDACVRLDPSVMTDKVFGNFQMCSQCWQ